MSLKKLEDLLQTGQKPQPYPTSLVKVKVVKVGHIANFTQSNGQEGSMLNFSVADNSGAVLATLSDVNQFDTVKEGKTLQIRNFLMKGGRLVLTEHTKIMQGPLFDVDAVHIEKATNIITPASPRKTVKETKDLPLRQMVTIQGEIVKDEAIKIVKVSQRDTNVRTITVEDEGQLIDVSLWRNLAEDPLVKIGENLEITHCITSEWQKKPTLSTTRNTVLRKILPREIIIFGTVEAISLKDNGIEISVHTNDQYKDFFVNNDIMIEKISELQLMEKSAKEEFLLQKIPFLIELRTQGSTVLNMELL
ncbi:uncharacterized protein LOC133204098 [Saccostrea echinata]|uniref:uncharacterized protein LOC133171748 n=1 Tax=Saccostrea echinata TaxID=191078 RepID=UPI002A80319E|nr:uncharacterized protein LOC133171748 [Saccostrea echinata]XP_061195842.1 uncharacterized protein LOC133204098 [Saccostrea echinata]